MSDAAPLWTRNFLSIFFAQSIVVGAHFGAMITMPLFINGQWGLDGIALGATISLYLVTAIAFRPFTGFLIDRFGRKPVYFPSYLLFGLLFFFYPLAGTVLALAALRIIHGALWGSLMSGANTLAVDLIPENRRGEGIGIFGLALNLGQALGAAISTFFVEVFGFHGLYISSGVLVILGSVFVGRLHASSVVLDPKPFALSRLLERTSLPASMVICLIAVSFGGVINYSAYYAATAISASSGIFFLCLACGMAFSRLFIGRIFDRSGPGKLMGFAFCCILLSIALKGATRLDIPFYASGLSAGLGCGIAIPVCQAMVNSLVPPQKRGGANATFLTAMDAGILAGILSIGWMQKIFGWTACHGLEACLVVLAALF
ncbi:MAG: MFS transporter, partial [Desulfovibrio sp.]|nr:MFS transporter [Desulfovibrio sp.]